MFLRGHKLCGIAKRFGVNPGSMKRYSSQGQWGTLKAELKDATRATITSIQTQTADATKVVSKAVTEFLQTSLSQAERLAGHGEALATSAPDPRGYGEAVRGWAVAVGQGRLALGLGEPGAGGQQAGITLNIGLLGRDDLRIVAQSTDVSAQSGRDNSAVIDADSASGSK